MKNAYFREIRDFFVNFNAFNFICEGFRVLSAAFVRILLCVTLEHLTVLSLDLVFIYAVNIRCSEILNVLFDRFLSLH